MKCKDCKLNSSCTMVWRTSKKDCPHFIRQTNADRIRDMSDEELAEFWDSGWCERVCPDTWQEPCDQNCTPKILDWLRHPAEGEQHG